MRPGSCWQLFFGHYTRTEIPPFPWFPLSGQARETRHFMALTERHLPDSSTLWLCWRALALL